MKQLFFIYLEWEFFKMAGIPHEDGYNIYDVEGS